MPGIRLLQVIAKSFNNSVSRHDVVCVSDDLLMQVSVNEMTKLPGGIDHVINHLLRTRSTADTVY